MSAQSDLSKAMRILSENRWGRKGRNMCIVDAVKKAVKGDWPRFVSAYKLLFSTVVEMYGRLPKNTNLHDWNDRPERTKRQVLSVLKRASGSL